MSPIDELSLPDSNSQYEELGPGHNSYSTINAQQNDEYEQPVINHVFVQPVNKRNNIPHEYENVQGATGRVRDGVRHKNYTLSLGPSNVTVRVFTEYLNTLGLNYGRIAHTAIVRITCQP